MSEKTKQKKNLSVKGAMGLHIAPGKYNLKKGREREKEIETKGWQGDIKIVISKGIQLARSPRIAFSVHVRASNSKSSIE